VEAKNAAVVNLVFMVRDVLCGSVGVATGESLTLSDHA
jgi:hypothetical protein